MVCGALDGVITTLAVVAGTSGAHLGPRVGSSWGSANLIGDGISMGASNYLGLKSELEHRTAAMSALEMLLVGVVAGLAAFVVGVAGSAFVKGG